MPLRDSILAAAAADSEFEDHYIPEWGSQVRIRPMTARMRDRFELAYEQAKAAGTVRATVAVACCYDPETGRRIFGDADVDTLADSNAAALARVFNAASRLSGLTKEDVEALEGN